MQPKGPEGVSVGLRVRMRGEVKVPGRGPSCTGWGRGPGIRCKSKMTSQQLVSSSLLSLYSPSSCHLLFNSEAYACSGQFGEEVALVICSVGV